MGELVWIFLLSTSKFLAGILWALATDLDWFTGLIITGSGGIIGVIFYLYFFDFLIKFIGNKTKNVKVKFNRWRRFMISLKQKGGLLGIAIATPMLLSIPIGIVLSLSLGSTRRRIMIFHITSIVLWSVLVFAIKFGLGYDVTETLSK